MTPFDFALPRFAQGERRHPAATAVDQFFQGGTTAQRFSSTKAHFPANVFDSRGTRR